MKFALCLLCVLVVIQGFEGHFVKDKVERGLSDVWGAIKSAGRKIKEIYNDIGYYIPRHMENLKNMARHTKDLIPQLTDSYKRKFQALTYKIKDIGSKCYAVNLRDLSNLNNESDIKLRRCTPDLRMHRYSLRSMMDNLSSQTRQTKQTIGETVKYCFSQYPWWKINPLYHCISTRLDDTLSLLKERVHKSLEAVKDAVEAVTVDVAKCVANAQKELYDQEKQLFVSVKECIKRETISDGYDKSSYTVTEREDRYNTEPVISWGRYTIPYPEARFNPSVYHKMMESNIDETSNPPVIISGRYTTHYPSPRPYQTTESDKYTTDYPEIYWENKQVPSTTISSDYEYDY